MDKRDIIAIPVFSVLAILLGVLDEVFAWNDTELFIALSVIGCTACGLLWHFDWSRLLRGSRHASTPGT